MKIEGSSQLADQEYDSSKKILKLTFHSGVAWNYQPITATLYQRFLHAESKGKFFAEHIKNNKHIQATKVGGTQASPITTSVKVDKTKAAKMEAKNYEKQSIEELSRDFHKLTGSLR